MQTFVLRRTCKLWLKCWQWFVAHLMFLTRNILHNCSLDWKIGVGLSPRGLRWPHLKCHRSIHLLLLFVLKACSNSLSLSLLMKLYIAHDCVQQIPNGLGVIVCVIQLTVYMIYYKSTNIQEVPQNDVDLPAYSGLFKSDRPVRFWLSWYLPT